MNQRELIFRRALLIEMRKFWSAAIHVENHLNPGIPDLSFVMNSDSCETGWLELKSVAEGTYIPLKIEPGQHNWMELHARRIPAFFLVEVGCVIYLVHGIRHPELTKPMEKHQLRALSLWHGTDYQQLAHILKDLTVRTRNV